jgi:hypothetical protein
VKVVANQLNLAASTTLHYATAHLHPYGESLELYDLTTSRGILKIQAEDFHDKVGVMHMGEFQSAGGIVVDPSHQYELRAEYNNTTSKDVDAMAIMYLYLLENDFHYPSAKSLEVRHISPFERLEHLVGLSRPG